MNYLEKNIKAIREKNPCLADKLEKTAANDDYTGVIESKTSLPVPVFNTGHALYSKYNPLNEMPPLFPTPEKISERMILFCGIGSGIQIRYFLRHFPGVSCAVTEYTVAGLKCLLQLADLSDCLTDPRVSILDCIAEKNFAASLAAHYIPVLDGTLHTVMLRPWRIFYAEHLQHIQPIISNALQLIESDAATQAYFGKLWLKNIIQNMHTASRSNMCIPQADTSRTALIVGAGPSLTEKISYIKSNRNRFVIFAADTAYLALAKNGIESDFFLSVDGQIFSVQHLSIKPNKKTIGIFDLCACSVLARNFAAEGNGILFTASNHPLARYAAFLYPIPFANSGSGTVALYAADVAHRLGFKRFEMLGLDFAYTAGKAYANGTYLYGQAQAQASRLNPAESFFTRLMFRTPTLRFQLDGKLCYTTALLQQYKKLSESYEHDNNTWQAGESVSVNADTFTENLIAEIKKESGTAKITMLPFMAYCKKYEITYSTGLVIDTILKYNIGI